MNESPIRSCLSKLSVSHDPKIRAIATGVAEYLDTRDRSVIAKLPPGGPSEAGEPAALAMTTCPGHPDAEAVLELVALLIGEERYQDALVNCQCGGVFRYSAFSYGDVQQQQAARAALLAAARRVQVDDLKIARYVMLEHGLKLEHGWSDSGIETPFGSNCDPRYFDQTPPDEWTPELPMERLIWNLSDDLLSELILAEIPSSRGIFQSPSKAPAAFLGLLAKFKPAVLKHWMSRAVTGVSFCLWDWQHILVASDQFDGQALTLAANLPAADRLSLLMMISYLRENSHLDLVRDAALATGKEGHATAMAFLADHFPVDLSVRMEKAIVGNELTHEIPSFVLEKAFASIASNWSQGSRAVFDAIHTLPFKTSGDAWSRDATTSLYSQAVGGLLSASPAPPAEEIHEWVAKALTTMTAAGVDKKLSARGLEGFWNEVVKRSATPLRQELSVLLGDKLKTLRQLAVKGLASIADSELILQALGFVRQGKLDQKLGAAELLGRIGDAACIESLEEALISEKNEKARAAIHEALNDLRRKCGLTAEPPSQEVPLADLESSIAKQVSKLKLPATPWLKREALPPLCANDGTALSFDAVGFLMAKQAKHKNFEAAPDALLLLAHIDREKSAPFAVALVEGFLNSDQAASDRWALALGGLLGDNRVITLLLPRINDWCENSRHKLAEYAAQAISLLPGNEPLMVLDTLSNRYRSKFKNVGKACAEAFNAAATARGITTDELGDLVVPDFGFDAEGIRRFDWNGGGASAELGADFKLIWFDPETEKSWKALPVNASEAIKDEVKTLTKLLREAVKGQTTRLEMTLVRQRRWPVARWRELYETHPLLRSFASSLVWGVYDDTGKLLRTFRRYPNGLLAGADGALEELAESDSMIGMVHPLELEKEGLDAWRAHLARFKVKQPFPQIERPVELLDPLHGNRREISLTNGKKLSAGTFRSRAEKRGWTRGSVIDAGGISSYYKLYPGAGVEVILPTNDFWIGCDPMDTIELCAAYFAKAGTVERGSYVYNEPAPGDPRVLRFDEVSAVVFSETLGDLKAIIATKE